MRSALLLVVMLIGCLTPTGATGATVDDHRLGPLQRIDAAVSRGEISFSRGAAQKLWFLFDRRRVDPAWGVEGEPPAKCGTPVIAELQRQRERLDAETRDLLARLTEGPEATAAIATHQTARFEIEYQTSGPDAPPQADVAPANGVPDFVEWVGAACEQAWAVEVDQLGYRAPDVGHGANARYPVSFQAQNAYGYTIVVNGERTRMVLHPNYEGFPFNDDPEGDVIGALRVTVAHELKHAIQRRYTPWDEGQWLELDATWVEEIVFDSVNDYVHFIRGANSPFTAPQTSLLAGGAGSYEDCNWQLYLTATLGLGHMRAFWERRAAIPSEPAIVTYEHNLTASGTSLGAAWGEYVAWNFASGQRAGPGFGYEEASLYPTVPPSFVHDQLPVPWTSSTVAGLAARAHLIPNPDATLGGTPEFSFSGAPGIAWRVSVVFRTRAGVVARAVVPVTSGAGTLLLQSLDWAELDWAAMVIGNPTPAPLAAMYSFSARAVAPVTITHSRLPDSAESPLPFAVRARVVSGTETLAPASVSLVYRSGAGPPTHLPMAPTGAPDEYRADIPFHVAGSILEYRVEAASVTGALAGSPSIPGAFHAFQVLNVYEPFEVAGEWTVGAPGDAATSGQWAVATPLGTIAAPDADATRPPGSACFVTGNGVFGGSAGAADVDDGRTTLLSPVYRFYQGPLAQATARYQRWYSNHIGARPDDSWRVDVSNDGGTNWIPLENVTQGENAWIPVEVDLVALFGTPQQVQFRFVAEDAGVPSLVEAALDDFAILAPPLEQVGIPAATAGRGIGAPFPNPSRGRARVRFETSTATRATAAVLDLQGRRVRRLSAADAWIPAGGATFEWDGRAEDDCEAPAGLYWIEVRVAEARFRTRLVRLR